MRDLWLVAAGGALGAVTRFGIGWLATHFLGQKFPWGTLAANAVGCLLIGVLMPYLAASYEINAASAVTNPQRLGPETAQLLQKLLVVGFLGGLTTFSALAWESWQLQQQQNHYGAALTNVSLNLLVGLAGVWLGSSLSWWLVVGIGSRIT